MLTNRNNHNKPEACINISPTQDYPPGFKRFFLKIRDAKTAR
jgi:hypothetical protein